MPSPVQFSFGRHSSFILYCDGRIIHSDLAWAFRKTVLPRMKAPYHIHFGPGEDEYYVFYENKDGIREWSMNHPLTPSQITLEAFLKIQVEERSHILPFIIVATATNGHHLAFTPAGCTDLNNIPPSMAKAILDRIDVFKVVGSKYKSCRITDEMIKFGRIPDFKFKAASTHVPSQMSIGVDGTWFIKWEDGVCAWDLKAPWQGLSLPKGYATRYVSLLPLLHNKARSENLSLCQLRSIKIDHLVLSPWDRNHWFVAKDNYSSFHYSLPQRIATMIAPVLQQYKEGSRVSTGSIVGTATSTLKDDECRTENWKSNRDHTTSFKVVGRDDEDEPPMYQDIENIKTNDEGPRHERLWRRLFGSSSSLSAENPQW